MKGARRILVVMAICITMLIGIVGAASAITNGQPDGDAHPYVGFAVFFDADNQPVGSCSGFLVSPTIFVTAGHCTAQTNLAFVWFQSHLDPSNLVISDAVPGLTFTHPDFCLGCGGGVPGVLTHDVGVVELMQAQTGTFAQLPEQGVLDRVPMHSEVTVVGYGVQDFARGGGRPTPLFDGMRYFASTELIASQHAGQDEFFKVTANPAKGKGGACYGDSGGPSLLGSTHIALGVNSFVKNDKCAGQTYSYRLDTEDALDFLHGFLSD